MSNEKKYRFMDVVYLSKQKGGKDAPTTFTFPYKIRIHSIRFPGCIK